MTRYRESVRSLLKERILDAAYERVTAEGWDRLKMTRIATTAGVSRQTVYTEYGSKAAIGQALVMREVERFLTGIQDQLLAHPGDMRAAITAAIGYTLRTAADNPLLKAILTSSRGGDEDLLTHLTTRSEPLLDTAIGMLTAYTAEVWAEIDAHSRELAVEAVVRLTVSHLVQPVLPPDLSAERIAEITMRIAHA
ncbi:MULTISPECIES: TetR/AcrR family transcriptional regulator [Streptomyces]|uniref:TetR/AcrR family transcriptional regulator n=2 Tax=Streptomyces TaxID=1883 RepID=A0A3M8F874_9ACTN|nr:MULTISPECIES: TetR family transcriptional regulator [Streptomyces]KNE82520.1 TetR family transcriptional regulator [Streptomyces fradiae]OFA49490.1 TetR family transcriptional regulator [Streptomyces fradiae]PQM23015.1 TetR/AcrR family transcriptional regulator [Streptomyces xinghaiensis]RKM97498.1 TetR/AcrR family transcriptional regulator [Streptomyces xinghaiensis]RNC74066.1 TetR/AcrR family transcriptional regulator [Streptomyces xinghaiensis]